MTPRAKLKTEEEAQILQKLKSMRPDLIRDITNRLFIVVNKMDLVKKVCERDCIVS